MTAEEVIETVAAMPALDWLKIQAGLAEMVATHFSASDLTETCAALAEAEAEFTKGSSMTGAEVRARLGVA